MTCAKRLTFFLGIATACLAGCGADGAGKNGQPYPNPLADTILEGDATPKAFEALTAPDPIASPARVAVFKTPRDGTSLDAPTEFAWEDVETGGQMAPPPPAAKLEGGALTGRGYLLAVQLEGTTNLLQVFTTNTSYTPDSAAWAKVAAAGDRPFSAWIM